MPASQDTTRSKGRAPDPRNSDIRALLIRTGNQCAHPGCSHPLVNERNQFIAQICHIEAAAPGGPRYNPSMSDEARRASSNLLVLCYRHHVESNDTGQYTVEVLRDIKRAHEAQFAATPFTPDASVVESIAREVAEYWRNVDHANSSEHIVPEIRIEIDADATAQSLIRSLWAELDRLDLELDELARSADRLPQEVRDALVKAGYELGTWDGLIGPENPTHNWNWEWINLGIGTLRSRIRVLLEQLDVRVLELELLTDPSNERVRERLAERRAASLDGARRCVIVD